MKLTMRATATLGKKVTLMTAAFVLAVSTLTAAVPFILSEKASAVSTVNVTNLSNWWFEDKANGHHELVASGMHVWTTGGSTNGSTRKSAGYTPVSPFSLANAADADIQFAGTPSGPLPSLQLGVDRDGDGDWDGYLVYEPWAYGTGNFWIDKPGFGVAGGQGYASFGTIADFASANQDAKVISVGYSLGTLGNHPDGDSIISKLKVNGTNYNFADTANPGITINGATTASKVYPAGTIRIQVSDPNYDKTVIEQKNTSGVYVPRFTYDASKGKSFTIQWLGDGEYRVQAFDTAGNTSSVLKFAIDTTAPQTTFNTPASGQTVGRIFTLSGTATDNIGLSRVYVQLVNREENKRYAGQTIHLSGNQDEWSYTVDANALNLPEGTYAAHVSVVDTIGNNSSVGWTSNFTLEKTAPVFEITNIAENDVIATKPSNKISVQGSLIDPAGAYTFLQLVKDGVSRATHTTYAPVANGTLAELNATGLEDGQYQLFASPTDYLGNDIPRSVINFTVDNTRPKVVVTSPVVDMTYADTVTVTGTAVDQNGIKDGKVNVILRNMNQSGSMGSNIESKQVVVNSDGTWTTSFDINGLDDSKQYGIQVLAYDVAGNESNGGSGQAVRPFKIDTTNPTGSVVYGNLNPINGNVIAYLTASEAIQTPAGWTKVSDVRFSKKYTRNTTETVTFYDLYNKEGNAQVSINWIDKTAPVISGVSNNGVYRGDVTFTISDEYFKSLYINNVEVETIDQGNGVYTPASPLTSDGTYIIKATDKANNETQVTIVVDNTAPAVVGDITYSPATLTNGDVLATITFDEAVTTISGDWEATDASNTVFTKEYTANTTGDVIDFRDAVGNAGQATVVINWIDKTAPVISSPITNGATVRGTAIFSVNDSSATVRVNGAVTTSRQVTGDGTYTVTATDAAGNVSDAFTFTINNAQTITLNPIDLQSATPLITGTALWVVDPAAVDSMTVTIDGNPYAATIDANGNWSVQVIEALENGAHTLVVNGTSFAFTTSIPASLLAPAITNPAAAGALGVTDDADAAGNGQEVEGASSENKAAQAVDADANKGIVMGLAWYWWLLILAGIALILWWIIAAIRRRQSQDA